MPIKHAFFTRYGGVSPKPFDSLNIDSISGDDENNVVKNRAIALKHFGANELLMLEGKQHSNKVFKVTNPGVAKGYDAAVTNTNIAIGLGVADCMPIIVFNKDCLGLIHAGWRGMRAKVISSTIETMKSEYGLDPKSAKAIIGPSIAAESYEVGDEVAKHFKYVRNNKLDLWAEAEDELMQHGIEQIENLKINTFKDKRFFSHRRGNPTGRFLAIVCKT